MGNKKGRGRPFKGSSYLQKRLGFRVSDEMLEEIEMICKEQDIRKTDFILRAIENQIQKERKESNPILERYAQWKEESIKGEN
tara:strand:- start:332 stop:580 length:249 start_codon:yes stop_codon:yes gene_type:complete